MQLFPDDFFHMVSLLGSDEGANGLPEGMSEFVRNLPSTIEGANMGAAVVSARRWSAITGQEVTPAQVVKEQMGLSLRGQDANAQSDDALQQGMKRSERTTQEEFKTDAREGKIESYVPEETPDALRQALGIDDLVINLPYDYGQYLDNDHPKIADALFDDTARVLKNADYIEQTGGPRHGDPIYSAVLHENGRTKSTKRMVSFMGWRSLNMTCFWMSKKHLRNSLKP
ncbi:MAG: hypothetical protein J5855_02855 [Mailhella sp.]|nr:hypothetical protein [Mailhella sp.]